MFATPLTRRGYVSRGIQPEVGEFVGEADFEATWVRCKSGLVREQFKVFQGFG